MLALGVVFGILLLLLLMAGMWLAFNMNDYGVNDWVDDEEENRVTERRSRVTRAEVRMDEVDRQTMQLDEREGRSQEVMAERTKPRGREEIYSISKHSPSVSLDSAISVGSPLDSTGGSLQLNNSLSGLRCTQLLASSDSAALPSVHMSPVEHLQERRGGRGEREGGGNCNGWRGFDQWSKSSRHRMVDRWVDQVQQAIDAGQVTNWWEEVGKRQLEMEGMTAKEVEEFWQSVTWFWGGEAILEERPESSVKLDWRAEVKEQVDKKTDTMEQQAMLREKVAEKIWDLRR